MLVEGREEGADQPDQETGELLLDWNKKRKKVGRMNEDIKVNWVFSSLNFSKFAQLWPPLPPSPATL